MTKKEKKVKSMKRSEDGLFDGKSLFEPNHVKFLIAKKFYETRKKLKII